MPDDKPWERVHREWNLHVYRWRFLLDSWEGGEVYRNAIYGFDRLGYPVRNMVRHKREYGVPGETESYLIYQGTDPATYATDNDYELRRARTPVPTLFRDAMERHLGAIYNQEVKREADPDVTKWWEDVDGTGTTIDDWMVDTVAPMLLTFGKLDLLFDHPPADDPGEIRTKADMTAAGVDACVVSVILPMNLRWWKLDRYGDYLEALVIEPDDDCDEYNLRHWTAEGSTVYGKDGTTVTPFAPHPFGRVPILRVYDRLRPRCSNVGLPRYEPIAELARHYYNMNSELILSDTTQAHPLLQGPEDYIQPDGTIPVGPSWMLPKKKNNVGGMASYEGFEYVSPPKDAAESIRLNMSEVVDQADRNSLLTKPAGAKGTGGNSVGQSGISKRLDASEASKLLSRIAGTLDKVETEVAAFARLVITDGAREPEDRDDIKVSYPTNFDLFSPIELATIAAEFQAILTGVGNAPESESAILKKLIRMILMGLDEDEYQIIDDEIDAYCGEAAKRLTQSNETSLVTAQASADAAVAQAAAIPLAQAPTPKVPKDTQAA